MNAASWLESLPADRWRGLLLEDGPRIATWVLSIAIAVQAGFIVTDLASGGASAAKAATRPGAHTAALDTTAITRAHLFGSAPRAANGENAPQTSMPLVLTGIMAGNDPQTGLAILGPTAQTTKVYAVGDNVPGGARLHLVYPEKVVIERNGELESLLLPRKGVSTAPLPTAAALGQNPALEHMRQVIAAQPGIIGDVMRPQPVMEHGKVTGFRVYPGRNRSMFMGLGLRPGDVVTAINGTPLDDKDRGEEILHTIGSASEVQVTVIRGGQTQDLTLNIAQLESQVDGASAAAAPAAVDAPGPGPDQAATAGAAPGTPVPPAGSQN